MYVIAGQAIGISNVITNKYYNVNVHLKCTSICMNLLN